MRHLKNKEVAEATERQAGMADNNMLSIPYSQYLMEMRSGRIFTIDEGFTEILGYTQEDVEAGLVFKQLVPDVEYNAIIEELKEQFIEKSYVCYQHEMLTKTGGTIEVVSFIRIQNKLLNGHRVLKVSIASLQGYEKE